MANKICPSCNTKALITDSYCMNCGHDLRNVEIQFDRPKIPSDKECPECRTGNHKFATSCKNCGYPFLKSSENPIINTENATKNEVSETLVEIPNFDGPKSASKTLVWGIAIVVLLFSLMFYLFYIEKSNSHKSNSSTSSQSQALEFKTDKDNSTSQYELLPDTTYISTPVTSSNDSIEITNSSANDVETINSSNTVVNPDGSVTVVTSTSTIVEEKYKKNLEPQTEVEIEKVFTKVEVEASFPGGEYAWRQYSQNNMDANTPIANGAPEGTYTVIVRFIVSKDGSISDVVAETQHGYGMEAAAVKVIKNGPKWVPAQQSGRNVSSYKRQTLTFVVNVD